jgi:transcription termination factor Rho
VFILLDSITRTARAFNNALSGGGRHEWRYRCSRDGNAAKILQRRVTPRKQARSRLWRPRSSNRQPHGRTIFQEFRAPEAANGARSQDRRSTHLSAVDISFPARVAELLLQPWELEKINLIRRGLATNPKAIQRLLMFVKKFPPTRRC